MVEPGSHGRGLPTRIDPFAGGERRSERWLVRCGVLTLVAVVLAGLGAPWLAPYDPLEQLDPTAGAMPPLSHRWAIRQNDGRWILAETVARTTGGLVWTRGDRTDTLRDDEVGNLTPDGVADQRRFLLGTDRFSRDVLSRLLYGARISLLVGLLSVALSMTIGIGVGAIAALGGWLIDAILMRAVDGLLAIPWLFLLIALVAIVPQGPWALILILGGSGWMATSRLTRAELQSLDQRQFVRAARALGASPRRIFFRHMLPHALAPLAVQATLYVGTMILTEAALSYLGLGVQPPHASWGSLIAEGRGALFFTWWVSAPAACALVMTVIALTVVADGLRDRLDPYRVPAG